MYEQKRLARFDEEAAAQLELMQSMAIGKFKARVGA